MTWDLFISHATEDKAEFVGSLAESLVSRGFKVWYDGFTLTLGDSLRTKIDQGLANSRYGVVVLSPNFFAKKWPQLELDGLFALERFGKKRILPVWHKVTVSDVERYSSMLAGRLGVSTAIGVEKVVQKIIEAVNQQDSPEPSSEDVAASTRLHPHSIEILQAAQAGDGTVITIWHNEGFDVASGGRPMGVTGDPRGIALNLHCIDELTENGLLKRQNDRMLVLTQEGYDYVLPTGVVEAPKARLPTLTDGNLTHAKEMMQAAVAGDGHILSISYDSGRALHAGARSLESRGDRRAEARWDSVLSELERSGLLLRRSTDPHLTVYLVSHVGFLWTDAANSLDATTGKG